MGWLLAGGVLLLAFMFKGGRSVSPVQVGPVAPGRPVTSTDAPVVPAPAPATAEFTVLPTTTILAPSTIVPGEQVILNPGAVPADLLGVVQAGGAASDQDLERAATRARQLGRDDLATYFDGRLAARRAAARTFEVVASTEPDHDAATGVPVERLEMVEREVPSSARPRADRTVRQSVQTNALPTARIDRNQLHALALRVADNLRRTAARSYDRTLMKSFQRGAGLAVDGAYGNNTRQALGFYGQIPASQLPASQY